MKPDYGIDAPGLRRRMFTLGVTGFVVTMSTIVATLRSSGPVSIIVTVLGIVATPSAVYGFGMSTYMTYNSRVGKIRMREHLLDLANLVVPWTGRERVLDVGCGPGLMLIGAARRLTTGKTVGIDLWQAEDQTDNSAAATMENARCEGVVKRVRVDTADARALPFSDNSFDIVLSYRAIHKLPNAIGRARAINEMLRVLRPNGTLVLADIAYLAEYQEQLTSRGIVNVLFCDGGIKSSIIGFLSGGTLRPQALICRCT